MATRAVLMCVLLSVLGVLFAVFGGPQPLAFWPIEGTADLLQRIAPLFLIALFVERALEVFISAWRGPEERVRKAARATTLGKITPEENARLVEYKSETLRIALSAGIALGIVVSAVGVRALALFMYPDQIEALAGWQRSLFTSVDVLVTGAVIGGGADGLHKIVKVFTSFLETSSARIEARRPASAPEA